MDQIVNNAPSNGFGVTIKCICFLNIHQVIMMAADFAVVEYCATFCAPKAAVVLLQILKQVKALHQFIQFGIGTHTCVARIAAMVFFHTGVKRDSLDALPRNTCIPVEDFCAFIRAVENAVSVRSFYRSAEINLPMSP